jgi:hypothetical protein
MDGITSKVSKGNTKEGVKRGIDTFAPSEDRKGTRAASKGKRQLKQRTQDGSMGGVKAKSKKPLRIRVVEAKDSLTKVDAPRFEQEAGEVDKALKHSFGKIISQASERYKASYALLRTSSHWEDGDSKRLIVALAHRYQKPHLLNGSLEPPVKRLVNSSKNSKCSSSSLKDLDWSRGWWTDDSFGMHYLHVHHKDGETIHRVYCKFSDRPRLQMTNGKLYWLFQKDS